MNAKDLVIPGAIVAGAYLLSQKKDNTLPVIPLTKPPQRVTTVSGLGYKQSCCRWINMGGYWAYVCGPGLCAGGLNGLGRFGAPSYLAIDSALKELPTTVSATSGDVLSWIKENWLLAGGIAIAAYLILK